MTEKKLYQSLAQVMSQIVVGKSQIDTGTAGKYKAFTVDAVLEQTKSLFPQSNIVTLVNNELVEQQYITKVGKYGGEKTTHNVIVKTIVTFIHTETGESHQSVALGEASDSGDKALSKAQTDGFKKALCQTLHLFDDDGDKDRTPSNEEEKIVKAVQKPVEKKQEPQKPVEKKQEPQKPVEVFNYEKLKEELMECGTLAEVQTVREKASNNKSKMSIEQQKEFVTLLTNTLNAIKEMENAK